MRRSENDSTPNGHVSRYLPELSGLIDHIGDAGFGGALLDFLYAAFDVEHVLIYRLAGARPTLILSASHGDAEYVEWASRHFLEHYLDFDPLQPAIRTAAAGVSPRLFRTDIESAPHRALFVKSRVKERVIVSGSAAGAMLAVSLVRPGRRGVLDARAASRMLDVFPLLLSSIGKHQKLYRRSVDVRPAFSSVELIESCLSNARAGLSRREEQVCARVIYGMSTSGIALDLNVGTESVVTYRKRAYQRLGIAGQFELVRWYVMEWGRGCHGPPN